MAVALQSTIHVIRKKIEQEEDRRLNDNREIVFRNWNEVFQQLHEWVSAANKISKEKPHAFDTAGVRCLLGIAATVIKGVTDLADAKEVTELAAHPEAIVDPYRRRPRRDRRAEERKKRRELKRMANPDEMYLPGRGNYIIPIRETETGSVTIDYDRLKRLNEEHKKDEREVKAEIARAHQQLMGAAKTA
jgi:hypothetical protein